MYIRKNWMASVPMSCTWVFCTNILVISSVDLDLNDHLLCIKSGSL